MKRLLVMLVFLLLGAVVNVAVAWGCSIWALDEEIVLWNLSGKPDLGMVQRVPPAWMKPRQWGLEMRDPYLIDARRSGFGVTETLIASTVGGTPLNYVLHVQDAGWPVLALTCYGEFSQTDKTRYIRLGGNSIPSLANPSWNHGVKAPDWLKPKSQTRNWFHSYKYPLPCWPLWIGFTINTIFYATILWVLFTGPFALRRMNRSKRGLCVKCAYDLQGHDHEACPECGVRTSRVRQ